VPAAPGGNRNNAPAAAETAGSPAARENPLDAGAGLVYADWLEERGRDEAAEAQQERAARCQAFDPDFNYESVLADLGLPEDWEVAVFPIGPRVRLGAWPGGRRGLL
jgi:uncharacterized protein (TIGR02996 family)